MGRWLIRIIQSWLALPLWVLIWVFGFLVPINAAGFFMLDTPTGTYAALAAGFVLTVNMFFIFANGGASKVLALPHLAAWIPLLGYILYRAVPGSGYESGSNEFWLALALVLANGISLGFDFYDTKQWMAGNRQVAGFPDEKVRF